MVDVLLMQQEASLEDEEREKQASKPFVTSRYTQGTLKGNLIDATLAQVRSEKAETSTKLAETLSKLKHCNETKLTLSEKLSD
jgi:hypothetical protein